MNTTSGSSITEQVTALHEAARRLLLFTMAGQHMRGGDGFVPVHCLREIADLAREGFNADELQELALDVAEWQENDAPWEPPTDLALRVIGTPDRRYRWLLLMEVASGGYAQHAISDDSFGSYADAFESGSAALVADGKGRAQRASDAANDRQMLLAPGAA